jgi:hypothetical protein
VNSGERGKSFVGHSRTRGFTGVLTVPLTKVDHQCVLT